MPTALETERRKYVPGGGTFRYDDVEEVEWLVSFGESAETICRALGRKPAAIAQNLRRAGRPDLARPFYRLDNRRRAA